jgi:hypothetical protein
MPSADRVARIREYEHRKRRHGRLMLASTILPFAAIAPIWALGHWLGPAVLMVLLPALLFGFLGLLIYDGLTWRCPFCRAALGYRRMSCTFCPSCGANLEAGGSRRRGESTEIEIPNLPE